MTSAKRVACVAAAAVGLICAVSAGAETSRDRPRTEQVPLGKPGRGDKPESPRDEQKEKTPASRLERFEKGATRPEPAESSPRPPGQGHGHHHEYANDVPALSVISGPVPATEPGTGPAMLLAPPDRKPGDTPFPSMRFDFERLRVGDGVSADRGRMELGVRSVVFQVVQTTYRENGVDTALRLTARHLKWRLYDTEGVEVGFGVGRADLDGADHNSGFSGALSVVMLFTSAFGMEYQSSWTSLNGVPLLDDEFALYYGPRFLSVRVGHHSLTSPTDKLGAWFAGISLRY